MPKKFNGANGAALRLKKELKEAEFSRNLAEFDRLTTNMLKRLDLLEELLRANDKDKSSIWLSSSLNRQRPHAMGRTQGEPLNGHPSKLLSVAI